MTSRAIRGLSCSGSARKGHAMVIVSGHLIVDEEAREDYRAGGADVVAQARRAPGCLDLAISADLLDPGRINVFERWATSARYSIGSSRIVLIRTAKQSYTRLTRRHKENATEAPSSPRLETAMTVSISDRAF